MNEEIKTGTLRFPAKENPYMEMALFNCPIELPYDVKSKYWLISGKFSGMKIFSPKRSLNQPKATCVCIHSINQSNHSISICLLFLFCSRVYISRSFKNCSIDFCDCFSTYTFSLEMGGRYWVNSAGEGMGNLRHAICICRDASLWKSKMWRLSFFALPPTPSNISDQPSPDPDPDPPDKRELLRTLYEVLHEVQTITIHFHDNLCQWWNRCKNGPETEL